MAWILCPVGRMSAILPVMLMKGKVSLPFDSRCVHALPLHILTGEMVVKLGDVYLIEI